MVATAKKNSTVTNNKKNQSTKNSTVTKSKKNQSTKNATVTNNKKNQSTNKPKSKVTKTTPTKKRISRKIDDLCEECDIDSYQACGFSGCCSIICMTCDNGFCNKHSKYREDSDTNINLGFINKKTTPKKNPKKTMLALCSIKII